MLIHGGAWHGVVRRACDVHGVHAGECSRVSALVVHTTLACVRYADVPACARLKRMHVCSDLSGMWKVYICAITMLFISRTIYL